MSKDKAKIACLPNGPYYLLNDMNPKVIPNIESSTGESLSTVTGVALCRCGGSSNKPFCDGTHGTNGFSDEKLETRVVDKRESYAGKKITIHDNRGVCAHAGICTDKLAAVFKFREKPMIDPDGAAAEDIVAIIEQCPSGALSYSIDKIEQTKEEREPMITVVENGPYVVRGGIELLGQTMNEGASAEIYALCRCGGSRNKPFCDGSHWQDKSIDKNI